MQRGDLRADVRLCCLALVEIFGWRLAGRGERAAAELMSSGTGPFASAGSTTVMAMSTAIAGYGNLQLLTEHRPAIVGLQDDATFVDRFEQYDDGINVDGFGLIHNDFFDHLVLLPEVHLQKGNPRRQTRTGDGLNFVVDYTYTYDDQSRPLSKIGALTITNGPDAGRQIQTSSVFSYY